MLLRELVAKLRSMTETIKMLSTENVALREENDGLVMMRATNSGLILLYNDKSEHNVYGFNFAILQFHDNIPPQRHILPPNLEYKTCIFQILRYMRYKFQNSGYMT